MTPWEINLFGEGSQVLKPSVWGEGERREGFMSKKYLKLSNRNTYRLFVRRFA